MFISSFLQDGLWHWGMFPKVWLLGSCKLQISYRSYGLHFLSGYRNQVGFSQIRSGFGLCFRSFVCSHFFLLYFVELIGESQ